MWTSFHLYLEGGIGAAADDFLVRSLWPEVTVEQDAGRLRRFFFLRYSDGGPHLRLRFQPASGNSLSADFEQRLRGRATSAAGRLEVHAYDRVEHYFGDRPESVYAELLNTATSSLALLLINNFEKGQRGVRWVALTCVLGLVLRDSCASSADYEQELQLSQAFALRSGKRLGIGPVAAGESAGQRWSSTVRTALPRVTAGLSPWQLRPTARLLRRVRRRGKSGQEVATHALHLLCNKTGFSLREEHEAFATLATLGPIQEGLE